VAGLLRQGRLHHGADEQVHHDNERLRLRFGAGERAGGLPAREAARRSALELHRLDRSAATADPHADAVPAEHHAEPRWRGWLVHAVHRAEHRSATTLLEVTFYKFVDGSCVERFLVGGSTRNLIRERSARPGEEPDASPTNAQFSVVVKSYGSTVVGVVNEHQGSGTRAEALSYNGFTSGANTVYLPNITRRLFGLFVTPFIIQNLGDGVASVQATFRTFDGTGVPVTIGRTIDSGRSSRSTRTRMTSTSARRVSRQQAVRRHRDLKPASRRRGEHARRRGIGREPRRLRGRRVTGGASTIYAAYASKNAASIDRYTTIVVQNLGASAVTRRSPSRPLVGSAGTANTYTFGTIQPNSSKPFDARFAFAGQPRSTRRARPAARTASPTASTAFVSPPAARRSAAAMNVISDVSGATAMGYAANAAPVDEVLSPNVTRTLGGANGWSTPIILQTVTPAALRSSGGASPTARSSRRRTSPSPMAQR